MLQLNIEPQEFYDEENNLFIPVDGCILQLEHSLISLSKWESKWEVAFLNEPKLTYEQQIDYIHCMTLNEVPDYAYLALKKSQINEIFDYISKKMTATVIKQQGPPKRSSKFVTSEMIYYWMAALHIPFQPCENWHLNRLLTLIEVASIESQPPKKKGRQATMIDNTRLNEARRLAMHTKG